MRLFLLSLGDATEELEAEDNLDSRLSIYESLLKQCIDAQQALRDSLADDQVSALVIRNNMLFVERLKLVDCHLSLSCFVFFTLLAVSEISHLIFAIYPILVFILWMLFKFQAFLSKKESGIR